MYIVYDHQIFGSQVYGGISRYFCEIATRIAPLDELRILSPFYVNKYLAEAHGVTVIGMHIPRLSNSTILMRMLNAPIVKMLLKKRPPAILHETYYSSTRLAPHDTATVITVYDMIHEMFGMFFSPLDRTAVNKACAVRRADHIICISEKTRNDLVAILNVNPAKISIIHLGCSLSSRDGLGAEDCGTQDPYILYVGRRSGYKNFPRLMQAYAHSPILRKYFRLLCFGGGRFSRMERQEISRLGLDPNRIVSVSGNDAALACAYKNAVALVCPSLYEGFGIPVLEAISNGCPVACSNTGALPEICGRAASYFGPTDTEDMSQAIERLVSSPEILSRMRADGFTQAKKFSWDKCADQTRNLYMALA